jgi:hypothetical protein
MEYTPFYEDEDEETVLCRGRFSDKLLPFKIVAGGIPLLLIPPLFVLYLLALPVTYYYFKTFIRSLQVVLTAHTVTVRYGSYSCGCCLWNQVERKVALEKTTDVTLEASWLHRYFSIERLSVRTASSSSGMTGGSGQGAYDMGGADIVLDGLVDCREFRRHLMRARAQLESTRSSISAPPPMVSPDNDRLVDLLERQIQVLTRLEEGLGTRGGTSGNEQGAKVV